MRANNPQIRQALLRDALSRQERDLPEAEGTVEVRSASTLGNSPDREIGRQVGTAKER